MHKKRGFFALEIVLFLFLFSIFSCIVMRFSAHSVVMLMESANKSEEIASIASAFDWLSRDMHTITDHQLFLKADDTLKIQNTQEKITWKLRASSLLRTVQRYNEKEKRWKKQHTSHIVGSVADVQFHCLYVHHNSLKIIKGITCDITLLKAQKPLQLHHIIALRNGEL